MSANRGLPVFEYHHRVGRLSHQSIEPVDESIPRWTIPDFAKQFRFDSSMTRIQIRIGYLTTGQKPTKNLLQNKPLRVRGQHRDKLLNSEKTSSIKRQLANRKIGNQGAEECS